MNYTNVIVTRNGHLIKAMLFHQSSNAFRPIVELVKNINMANSFPVCDNIDDIAADPAKPISILLTEINTETELSGYVFASTNVTLGDTLPEPPTMF